MQQVSASSSLRHSKTSDEIDRAATSSFDASLRSMQEPGRKLSDLELRVVDARQAFPPELRKPYKNFIHKMEEKQFEDFCFRYSGGDEAREIYGYMVENREDGMDDGKDFLIFHKKDKEILGELNYIVSADEDRDGELSADVNLMIDAGIKGIGMGLALLNAATAAARAQGCGSATQSIDNDNEPQRNRMSRHADEWKQVERGEKIATYRKEL